ncbi:carbohydrate kinase family protein [Psychroserpens algicola]|uniref:carbohydrate kinase family protein n=1 Tax=Psychroserpens algicola TaxID=1719034 RepID=UPI00195438AF|nr:PfkB family carbohydrate kinase [Psychroserpens algicola]
MKTLKITCFGEILWDIFPKHRKIGGAPLNVALRLTSFDNDVHIISRVGNDSLGRSLLAFIEEKEVDIQNVQVDSNFDTGQVNVILDNKGSATYDIVFPIAWDHIKITEANKALVASSDVFIFGSLIGRNLVSKHTLISLLDIAKYKVFDVNLRAPHYSKQLLIALMNQADFIKFNDEELFEISKYLGSKYNSIEQNLNYISKHTNTKHICVTKGKYGAVLLYNEALYYNSGYLVHVKDTVGAGDSFLATLINFLLKNENPQKAIDIACAVGALVAQNEGANPDISAKDIESFMYPY